MTAGVANIGRLKAGVAACALLAVAAPAGALPVGPAIVAQSSTLDGGPGATFNAAANLLTVTQNAQRVVIDWRGFNIGAGESVAFAQPGTGAIAFNRVLALDPTSIDGALRGNGGVWLFAPGGFVFGAGARVNVGSFVAATGAFGDAELAGAVGGGSTLDLSAGTGGLTVQSGAQIAGGVGGVLLQSAALTQNGAVTSAGGVTYVVSDGGRLRYTEGGVALDSLPGAASSAPQLSHGGSTVAAGTVLVAGQQPASGRTTAINLQGLIEADGVAADGSSLTVTGGGDNPVGGSGSGLAVDGRGGTLTAAGETFIEADAVRLGTVTGVSNLRVRGYGDVDLGAVNVAGDVDARTDAPGATLAVSAPVSGRGVNLFSAGDLRVAAAVTARSFAELYATRDLTVGATTIDVTGDGGLFLTAGRDLTADAASRLQSGPATAPGEVEAIAGDLQGGDLTLGAVSGGAVTLFAAGGGGRGGRLRTLGALKASGDVLLESIGDGSAGSEGGIAVLGPATVGGALSAYGFGGGEVLVGAGSQVTAASLTLNSAGDVRVAANAQAVSGGPVTIVATRTFTVEGGALVSGVTPAGTSTWPVARYPDPGQGVSLSAAGYDLRGTVSAGAAVTPDSAAVTAGAGEITAQLTGAGSVGDGATAPTVLSSASVQAFRARNLYLIGAEGRDLAVGSLTLDPSRLSALWIGTDPARALTVIGQITSAGATPSDLRLGFVHDGGFGQESYLPASLTVTGGLGAGGKLGALALAATGDILVGTDSFVAAARADANFDPVVSSVTYARGVPSLQVLLASNSVQFASAGRVFQQNTGLTLRFGGLVTGAPTADLPLIVALPGATGQAAGPTRIDVFGSFANADGSVTTGALLARYPFLLGDALTVKRVYRINACPFGALTGCAADPATATLPFPQVQLSPLLALVSQFTSSSAADISALVFLPKSADEEAERDAIAQPAAGLGNEDLYGVSSSLDALDERDRRERDRLGTPVTRPDAATTPGTPATPEPGKP